MREPTNYEGLTWEEWKYAAGVGTVYGDRRQWAAFLEWCNGVDPTEWRAYR